MFKFLRKKILEGIINDIIEQMPKWKVSARILFKEKKDEILKKAEQAVIETVKGVFEKELG
jgi:hypothetical protein